MVHQPESTLDGNLNHCPTSHSANFNGTNLWWELDVLCILYACFRENVGGGRDGKIPHTSLRSGRGKFRQVVGDENHRELVGYTCEVCGQEGNKVGLGGWAFQRQE